MKPLNKAQLMRRYELEFNPRYAWYRQARAAALFAAGLIWCVACWCVLTECFWVLSR
jgi:hypothetical protein